MAHVCGVVEPWVVRCRLQGHCKANLLGVLPFHDAACIWMAGRVVVHAIRSCKACLIQRENAADGHATVAAVTFMLREAVQSSRTHQAVRSGHIMVGSNPGGCQGCLRFKGQKRSGLAAGL